MRWTSIFVSAVLILVVAGAALTLYSRFTDPPINVILLTVESLRADRFTASVAPKFFEAAQEAVHFKDHRSIASWTGPNIVSLLTGLSPFAQGVHARGHSIAEWLDTPLERLARDGWAVGSTQAFAKTENFQNLGMTVVAGETLERWIARQTLAGKPFFFWHHYLETHLPYDPEQRFLPSDLQLPAEGEPAFERMQALRQQPALRAGSIVFEAADRPLIDALYSGGIRQFDAWFAAFWKFFTAAGLRDNTILIVTADHGEELLERGNVGHASTTAAGTLFEESVRVPLFIWWPPRLTPMLIERSSDHLDIMPTVLEALGQGGQAALPGSTLTEARKSPEWYAVTSKAGFAEAEPDTVKDFIAAVSEERWKLIVRTKRREVLDVRLYDLSTDPQEHRDLAADRPDIVGRMLPKLTERLANLTIPDKEPRRTFRGKAQAPPQWVSPAKSGAVSWDDLQGHLYLEWAGEAPSYVLEYTAGTGVLSVTGELTVNGPRKDFGVFSRSYWETWIVPYREVTLRVRAESGERWSDPLTIKLSK